MRIFRAFYSIQRDGLQVPSDDPDEMNEADIYSHLLGDLAADGDFFGVIDDYDCTLQVMYEADGDKYWVELPHPDERGSYGRRLSFDEVTELFKALPSRFLPVAFPSFQFESWE